MKRLLAVITLLLMAGVAAPVYAEDGYEMWLRYKPINDGA
jgi:hypothetical protein